MTETTTIVPPRRKRFRLFKKILVGLVVIVLAFAAVVATRPGDFTIERSATIAAPAEAVFAQVNDFHNWEGWSPWAKLDPAMQQSFGGPAAGTGATDRWEGNSDVGEGGMTITESRPPELVRIKLEFLKPFAATNLTEFTFKPQGEQTRVTWTMSGHNGFMAKAFCMFMDMDKMVGGDFEKGLAALKSVSESMARK
jgi:uncharacterized protein YndB with AHSA1/START domain